MTEEIKFNPWKTVEGIYAEADIVLIDACVSGDRMSSWYQDCIFPAKSFGDLDSDLLRYQLTSLNNFKSLFLNDKSLTIPDVVIAHERLRDIVNEKLLYLNNREKHKKRVLKHGDGYSQDFSLANQNLFEDIDFSLHQNCKLAKRKLAKYSSQHEFNKLDKIVAEVIERTGAKDKNWGHEFRNNERYEALKTDDQLSATAFYFSLIEKKAPTIFTADSDLVRIVNYTYDRLVKLPEYKSRMAELKSHPVRVYFAENDNLAFCSIDTSHPQIMIYRGDHGMPAEGLL